MAHLGGNNSNEIEDDANSPGPSPPSLIGEVLAEQMSQRVVILVLLVLFIAPVSGVFSE